MSNSVDQEQQVRATMRRGVLRDRLLWIASSIVVLWMAGYWVLAHASADNEAMAKFVANVVYVVPLFVAAVMCVVAATRTRGRARRMWLVLALAVSSWTLGEVVFGGYEYLAVGEVPYPSWADPFYLSANIFAIPAMLIGFGGAKGLRHVRGLFDSGLVVLGLGAVAYELLIRPQLTGTVDAGVLVTAAYPILDLALVACLVGIGLAGHRMVPYSVLMVGSAFFVSVFVDSAYTYLLTTGNDFDDTWIKVTWQFTAMLIAVAALLAMRHSEGEALPQQLDRDLALPPVLVAAVAAFVLVVLDNRDGSLRGYTMVVAGIMLAGLIGRQILFTRDRSRLAKELQDTLVEQERLAVTDGLTGLYNRRFLIETLKLEGERCARSGRPLSLIVVDLDHFKKVNDTYGHPAGDAVLVHAADRIRQLSRSSDIVARYGGEEFVILLPDTDDEAALELAERIRNGLRRSPVAAAHGVNITITGSLGVGTSWADPVTGRLDADALVVDADRALYFAKEHGRDRVAVAGSTEQDQQQFEQQVQDLELPAALLWIADRIDAMTSTHEHSTAVQRWAQILGRHLGLDHATLAATSAAARLHDIGKIGVAEAILGKAGALEPAELQQLRRHCEQGARMLRDVARRPDLAPIVEAHHERHDGTGYPHGLTGDLIPLEARIIAVCDAWAELRLDRPNTPARTVEQARAELVSRRGTHFDPNVTDAFLAVLDAGLIDEPHLLPAQTPEVAVLNRAG